MLGVDADSIELAADAFERQLPGLVRRLISFDELHALDGSSGQGAPTCCPYRQAAMLLLQFRYGLSERELYQRCLRDLGFRYALGLEPGERPPSARTLRRFRSRLVAAKGADFLFKVVLAVACEEGAIDDVALQAIDSTNTDCRGAVIDTFNLIAAGIWQVIRVVARCLGRHAGALACEWDLDRYMARSIKGGAAIDWSVEDQRNALLTKEIRDADRLAKEVESVSATVTLPPQVDEALALLARVARQDVEELEDGTFRIARGTAKGRIVSISDPEARHGRKSKSKVIKGFKTHVLGTIESQFVTGIAITDAGVHDSAPTTTLLGQAEGNGVKPKEALGDNAYGTGPNLRACNALGVEMHTKPGRPSSRGALPKRDFEIDLENMRVTCPAGQTTSRWTTGFAGDGSDDRVPVFHFNKATCQQCPLKDACCAATARGRNRTIRLNSHEAELQANRRFAESDRGRELLRTRSAVERLISHLVRMGMRHARFFTMQKVQLQAYMVAAAYNLQRLMTLRAARPPG